MITVELVKLLRRPRTWISVVLTCALPFMVAVFITVTHLVPPPGQGSAFLSAVLQDGALYPAAALALVLPVFLPVAVAVVAGDSIAGEATGGTLRYLLVRHSDAAALNARLVGAGLRVSSIGPQQRTLEEIVLAVTGTGSDHIGGTA